MKRGEGVDQAGLRLLADARTKFELIAIPVRRGDATWWGLDVVLRRDGRRPVVKAQRKRSERKVWRQLSALYRFVRDTVPGVEQITVRMNETTDSREDSK